jgi:type IV secretion system protein VirD4
MWPATVVAGGGPGFDLGWPYLVLEALLRGHPIGAWCWDRCSFTPHPHLFWGTLTAELVTLAAATCLGLIEVAGGRPSRLPAASRWARRWDLRRAGLLVPRPCRGRVALGKCGRHLVAAHQGVSVLVFGPTGSGKTAGVCVPVIVEWEGSVVAVSVKNDLVVRTAGPRQRQGPTHVYDPTGITGLATCTWSPAQRCEDWDRAMRVGQWLVQAGRSPSGDAEWEHWEDAAIRLVSCTLYASAALGRPIAEALAWLDDGSGHKLGLALASIPAPDPRALQWYQSVQERPDRERASCYSTSQKVLRAYIDRAVAASAQDCSFDPRAFLESGTETLYLVAPQTEQERLSGVFGSLVMTIMTEAIVLAQASATGRLSRPLLVVLDECANTAPIRELPSYMSTVRSMGITVIPVFQDMSQCEARYQGLAGSITNNARGVLFLHGSKDRKTLEVMRDLVGRQSLLRRTLDNRGGEQVAFEKDDLLPLDIGRQLRPGRAVLLYEHLPPLLLRMRNCYRDRDLLDRTDRQPFLPNVTQVVYDGTKVGMV